GFTENILLTDINKDGAIDILIGKSTGALQYLENSGPAGSFNFALKNPTYLNLGISTARQNLSIAAGDLDADGNEELITGDQRGVLTVFNNFRSTNPVPVGVTDIIYDSLNNLYSSKNLGGRVWPAITNLFNTNKPAVVVGNTSGGIYILKNDDSIVLPDEPVVIISPNPLPKGEKLNIRADRNITMQIFSLLGQKISEPQFIPANQSYDVPIQNISPGLYIARFTGGGKNFSSKFVIQ
ncbi:MAG TPA: T9SS type A sorting domain-containing protein, partial [Cyclobacteriaceae bacterium]